MEKYQTISEFLANPFHSRNTAGRDSSYDISYNEFIKNNKMKINAVSIISDSYYFHIKVPSESMKERDYFYDVIIRFFPESKDISEQSHLRNYKIQFFSNSPSFIYKYAYVYKKNGYLIEALYNKLDPDYLNKPPEKTNKDMIVGYDKSIYAACKYLTEGKFKYLEKASGLLHDKAVSPDVFFRGISDFKSIKLDQFIIAEEKKLQKSSSTSKERNLSTDKSSKSNTNLSTVKKITANSKVTANKKITPKKKK